MLLGAMASVMDFGDNFQRVMRFNPSAFRCQCMASAGPVHGVGGNGTKGDLMDTLATNVPILFGEAGTHRRFTVAGWSEDSNKDTTWTVTHVAELEFRNGVLKRDPLLRIRATPFIVANELPFQEINVYLNGIWLTYALAANDISLEVRVSRNFFNSQRNLLSFALPRATCPRDRGWNEDQRILGFAFQRVELADA